MRANVRARLKNDASPPVAVGASKVSLKSSYHTKSVNSVQQTQEYLIGGMVQQTLSANQKLQKQVSPSRITVLKPMDYKFSDY